MSRPNILFLHSHNTGRYVQPYGHAVPTPNLQRLASEGVTFRQAFAAAPTCSPSRAAFLSGQYPHCAGMVGLAHRGFVMHDYSQHIVHTLRAAGYETALAGVEHTAMRNDTVGYDRLLSQRDSNLAGGGGRRQPAPAVVEYLAESHERPFFVSMGLNETHRPFPEPDPANHPAEDARWCAVPRPLPDTPEIRGEMAAFKASARIMDDAYGQVLDALDATGLAENTLVFCFADHGLQFPMNMCNLTDHGLGVYLVARGPGFAGGQVNDALVSLIDLFPTVCDAAGIDPPAWLQGESLLPLVAGERERVHDVLYGEVSYHAAYEPMRSVRDERWTYIRRFDGRDRLVLPNTDDGDSKTWLLEHGWADQPREQEMLFDTRFDPDETHNLVEDPRARATLAMLRGLLEAWMRDTDDPLLSGDVPAPDGALANDADGYSPREEPRPVG